VAADTTQKSAVDDVTDDSTDQNRIILEQIAAPLPEAQQSEKGDRTGGTTLIPDNGPLHQSSYLRISEFEGCTGTFEPGVSVQLWDSFPGSTKGRTLPEDVWLWTRPQWAAGPRERSLSSHPVLKPLTHGGDMGRLQGSNRWPTAS
jgi:hypothetical protein